MESFKVGKVKVTQVAPKIFKFNFVSIWWWYSDNHFEKAIAELSKKYKILTAIRMTSWLNYYLIIVE